MAIYYTDLSLPGTVGDGSIGNPFSFDSWRVISSSGNTYYMKGYVSQNYASVNFFGNIYLPWDPTINGYWGIHIGQQNQSTAFTFYIPYVNTITGAYLSINSPYASEGGFSFPSFSWSGTTFNSCVLKATQTNPALNNMRFNCLRAGTQQTVNFKGCWIYLQNRSAKFVSGGPPFGTAFANFNFTDCVYNTGSAIETDQNAWVNGSFTNTVSNLSSGGIIGGCCSGTFNYVNSQFNWVPPVNFPPFGDYTKTNWQSSTFTAGVNTPPQPGIPPYTNYNTGMWGEPRTGIGALYFGSAAVQVSTPVISPTAGTFLDSVGVTITCATSGASIYYTTDGSTPSAGSTLYSGLFTLTESKTVKAIGIKAGDTDSEIASSVFTVKVSAPSISPNGGTTVGSAFVNLSCTTSGASIYYTTDGSTPSASSTLYTTPFTLTENTTLKAIGIRSGNTDSDVTTANFIIKVESPIISPASATYIESVSVTLSCATVGAVIHYTTDGTTPSGSSAIYTVPFDLTSTSPVKAIAIKTNMSDSDVSVSLFTIQVATPVIHPNGGTSLGFAEITLTCTTSGSTIYYTTDGSTPTGASLVYAGAFRIYNTCTVQAIGTKSGTIDSAVGSASFTINSSPEITIQPRSGNVLEGQAIGLFVTATGGTPNLSYQWRFNGETIPFATSADLIISSSTMANSGAYDVVVSNIYSGVISNQALVNVVKQTPEVDIDPIKRETAVAVPASPSKNETL